MEAARFFQTFSDLGTPENRTLDSQMCLLIFGVGKAIMLENNMLVCIIISHSISFSLNNCKTALLKKKLFGLTLSRVLQELEYLKVKITEMIG